MTGSYEEAMDVADGLIEAAESTENPWVLSYAYLGCGLVYRRSEPTRALELLRRGLDIARESGNRFNESHLAHLLAGVEVEHGDPAAALDHIIFALRNYQNAGSVAFYYPTLASLAMLLDKLGQLAPAATFTGFAAQSQLALALYPELTDLIIRLREALGHQTFELLAEKGATMPLAAMAAYAYEQIDHARAQLQQLR